MPPIKSTKVGPALTGGPSGNPVTLMIPEAAWMVMSIARLSRSGPVMPKPVHDLPANPEPVHRARREVFQKHVGAFNHAQQQIAAARLLEVEGHRMLVLV